MHYRSDYTCEDCNNSFYYPGQNSPMVVEGGCPECGGNIRPEPDQPSPVNSDGDLRDMAGPGYDQDMGGNPLQEGILGQTDGGWQNRQKRDESFASVKNSTPESIVRFHPESSNQEVHMPWAHFEVEEVAPPGVSNEEAEKIMDKKAFLPALALAPELLGAGGAAAGAAEGGAAAGGGGLGFGLLRRAVPSLMGSALGKGLGGGGSAQGAPQQAVTDDQERPFESIASVDADDDKGSDLSDPRGTDTEDEQDADPKQKDDGDNTNWQKDVSVDEGGGGSITGLSPDADPESPTPGLESLQMMLPLVVHYAESPDAGADHPLIKALHELLTSEGLLGGPEDHGAASEVIQHHRKNAASPAWTQGGGYMPNAFDTMQSDIPGDMSIQQWNQQGRPDKLPGQTENPLSQGNCALCGSTTTPGQPCPQCGAVGTTNNLVMAADAGQGPATPEQIAAVQQHLIDSGRVNEVPNVPVNPSQYAREMAEVANKPDMPPPAVQNQPMPAQEEAPPQDTMPMPGMEVPQGGVTANIGFGQCQKCSGPLQADGSCAGCERTPAAGMGVVAPGTPQAGAPQGNMNAGTPPNPAMQQFGPTPVSRPPAYASFGWTVVGHGEDGAAMGVPAADQQQQYDPGADQDSSHQWQATDGTPVVQGQQYELRTPGVAIPDVVTVSRVLPDAIELEFTGEYQLGFKKQITRQEWDTMGYTLMASNGTPDAPPESQGQTGRPEDENGASVDQGQGAMGMSGFSPPQGVISNVPQLRVPGVDPETGQALSQERQAAVQRLLSLAAGDDGDIPDSALAADEDGLPANEESVRTAGAHFTPSAQRELIDEVGVARNADKMDLSNTHYEAHAPLKTTVDADSFLW